ncbi:trace amine-associated receptor 13c-like [Thalassophryne amazonica]|uniref:trace amine-associated receptor 13c-like n=1 Tax=Thalassophryne amazonica TaxID=390379 RepID=UPI00147181DF|nr:trace amine-associated receptor 13c-like [Thalassophryne amazonica]
MMETQDGAELCFPELLNTSCRKPAPPWHPAVLFHILLSSISVVTATLNLLVIISVSHFRQLHFPSNLLLLSLAISDFLVGLILIPTEILRQTACWFLGDLMCSLYIYVSYIITFSSIGDMVLISVDRYIAICHPLHYSTRVTVRKVQISVCLCWLFSLVFITLLLQEDLHRPGSYHSCRGECLYVINSTAGIFDIIFCFILPIAIIITLYMRVFVVAVSQARAMCSHVTAVRNKQSVKATANKSELKAARTLGVVVLVFLLCFCPFYCVALSGENVLNASAAAFVNILYYFNSCLNPVIYALFYPWFRKAIKLIATLQILRPGSSEANIL